jgi:hypothetical protein
MFEDYPAIEFTLLISISRRQHEELRHVCVQAEFVGMGSRQRQSKAEPK